MKIVVVVAVILIAGSIVGAYSVTGGFRTSRATGPAVLLPELAYYTLPGGQFNAVDFTAQGPSVVNGTFENTEGITLYQMTPAQALSLSKTGVVGTYEWTSGRIANLTVTNLNLQVPAGAWSLIFLNADNPGVYVGGAFTNTTIVTFFTPFILVSQ
ncbi:MAG TPA: hypothetical protein VML94_05460 [Thermoplasmata archaeon]|nr:hypothetical protein [Thermoplasmata archaeon]